MYLSSSYEEEEITAFFVSRVFDKKMEISDVKLTYMEAEKLCASIEGAQELEEIIFKNCQFDEAGIRKICQIVSQCHKLKSISFLRMKLDDREQRIIFNTISHFREFEKIDFSNCSMGEGFDFNDFPKVSKLNFRSLCMEGVQLNHSLISTIIKIIRHSNNLRSLTLGSDTTPCFFFNDLLSRLTSETNSLTSLSVRFQKPSDEFFEILTTAFRNKTLRLNHLSISMINLDRFCLEELERFLLNLNEFPSLKSLGLSFPLSQINGEEVAVLTNFIRSNSSVETLYIPKTYCGDTVFSKLKEALNHNFTMTIECGEHKEDRGITLESLNKRNQVVRKFYLILRELYTCISERELIAEENRSRFCSHLQRFSEFRSKLNNPAFPSSMDDYIFIVNTLIKIREHLSQSSLDSSCAPHLEDMDQYPWGPRGLLALLKLWDAEIKFTGSEESYKSLHNAQDHLSSLNHPSRMIRTLSHLRIADSCTNTLNRINKKSILNWEDLAQVFYFLAHCHLADYTQGEERCFNVQIPRELEKHILNRLVNYLAVGKWGSQDCPIEQLPQGEKLLRFLLLFIHNFSLRFFRDPEMQSRVFEKFYIIHQHYISGPMSGSLANAPSHAAHMLILHNIYRPGDSGDFSSFVEQSDTKKTLVLHIPLYVMWKAFGNQFFLIRNLNANVEAKKEPGIQEILAAMSIMTYHMSLIFSLKKELSAIANDPNIKIQEKKEKAVNYLLGKIRGATDPFSLKTLFEFIRSDVACQFLHMQRNPFLDRLRITFFGHPNRSHLFLPREMTYATRTFEKLLDEAVSKSFLVPENPIADLRQLRCYQRMP